MFNLAVDLDFIFTIELIQMANLNYPFDRLCLGWNFNLSLVVIINFELLTLITVTKFKLEQ